MFNTHTIYSKILKMEKRLTVYIPNSTNGPYRILFMHDGQNLFFPELSYAGVAWDAATKLQELINDNLIPPTLIVGIDHSIYRMDEYVPFNNDGIYENFSDKHRKPFFGNLYIKSIVEEILPFIESNYMVLKEYTYMAGSSLGGLISLYAGIKYHKVFKGIGIFSLSTWWNENGLDELLTFDDKLNQRYFILCGGNESGDNNPIKNERYILSSKKTYENLKTKVESIKFKLIPHGKHTEQFWQDHVKKMMLYLIK